VKLLLGTHIWVWSVLRPEKIRRKVRRHLDNPKNELYLSPISIWGSSSFGTPQQIAVEAGLCGMGRSSLAADPFAQSALELRCRGRIAPDSTAAADLGDLFLAATASVFDLTLVTGDSQFIECAWLKVLPND